MFNPSHKCQCLVYEILDQYQACLYLFECISHGESENGDEIQQFWNFEDLKTRQQQLNYVTFNPSQISMPSSQNTGPIPGMFVLIWMHFPWLFQNSKNVEHFVRFWTCRLQSVTDKTTNRSRYIRWNLLLMLNSSHILKPRLQITEPINTRHVCTYLNAFRKVIPNMIMKFQNVDICWQFCEILDLSSAHACRVVSVMDKTTNRSRFIG